jgi:hypothetical protein
MMASMDANEFADAGAFCAAMVMENAAVIGRRQQIRKRERM